MLAKAGARRQAAAIAALAGRPDVDAHFQPLTCRSSMRSIRAMACIPAIAQITPRASWSKAPHAHPRGRAVDQEPLFGAGHAATVRFSDAGARRLFTTPRPWPIRTGWRSNFIWPDGSTANIVVNSLRFFTVARPRISRFASGPMQQVPPGGPRSAELEAFCKAIQRGKSQRATVGTPASFAERFFGIDAFIFINKSGQRQPSATSSPPSKSCI